MSKSNLVSSRKNILKELKDSLIKIKDTHSYIKKLSNEKEEIIGEETRLLYVATTRAKEMLIIHSSKLIANSSSVSSWMNLIEKGGITYEDSVYK